LKKNCTTHFSRPAAGREKKGPKLDYCILTLWRFIGKNIPFPEEFCIIPVTSKENKQAIA
tara:strand:+ start:364 stop:543 length:180 start_codon:yes stop_codon:yes gene_type:complete